MELRPKCNFLDFVLLSISHKHLRLSLHAVTFPSTHEEKTLKHFEEARLSWLLQHDY